MIQLLSVHKNSNCISFEKKMCILQENEEKIFLFDE